MTRYPITDPETSSLATKYSTTVNINPEMTVPHTESKGFFTPTSTAVSRSKETYD